MEKDGATAVISHHIIEGKDQEYENWLDEIAPLCRIAEGHIDWQIIRPIPGLTYLYTVIIRFDTIDNLKRWMESDDRKRLIEKIRPLLAKDDSYHIRSGLDFLFVTENDKAVPPVRWKQFLVTWSAIYPLSTIIPLILIPLLRALKMPPMRFVDSFFVSGVIVLLMVYLIMPRYAKWIRGWLYK
ncbi:antibiotic biosynthesis monooxygenase [Flavobacterium tistrianum]|uniref:antibiotic biosynthesis monooxygenase n=1 Tax=Flavobacterium tistrianum TaxID=1685414 RepID=UPI000DAC5228|nr:antibiotic biosynthesis monooxygenase [Flavobacterium tistrianum]KAF2342961.1 antibiotic biosynthesis monooxygenase [Flavobacterium tistrianum]